MKPTASALRHFVVGAAATAIASTWSESSSAVVVAQPIERGVSRSADTPTDGRGDRDRFRRDDPELRDPVRSKTDDDGAMVSSSRPLRNVASATDFSAAAAETHRQCHPDLGVLACTRPGDVCAKTIPSPASQEDDGRGERDGDSWHCLPRRIQSPGKEGDVTFDHVRDATTDSKLKQQQQRKERSLNVFPPTGPIYDQCTYDEQLDYNYDSSIRLPSAWDRCVCMGYDYNLPSSTVYYTDVDYCFKIHKYYCKNYHPAIDVNKDYSQYEVCVCANYEGKPVPDKPDDFCVEIGSKHCQDYYPNGDLVGFANCLCTYFGYQDWCDWTPPPGFSPVPPPPPPTSTGPTETPTRYPTRQPTLPPTRQPTARPSREPTKRPTLPPTREPTRVPTLSPTGKPTGQPTRNPTAKPTRLPTQGPTTPPVPNPTSEPTVHPTPEPTSPPTRDPTRRPTLPPTRDPTRRPTLPPTRNPTSSPTHRPTHRPTPLSITRATPDPAQRVTQRPTQRPTLFPTMRQDPLTNESFASATPESTNKNTNGNKNNNRKKKRDKYKDKKKNEDDADGDGDGDGDVDANDGGDDSNVNTIFLDDTNGNTNVDNTEDSADGDEETKGPVRDQLNNISNLQNIIQSLRRQPNISQRPGSALRLQTYNVFVHDSESTSERDSINAISF